VSAAEAPVDVGALLTTADVRGLEGEGAAGGAAAEGPDGVLEGRDETLGGGREGEKGGEERTADGEEVEGVEEGELPGGGGAIVTVMGVGLVIGFGVIWRFDFC
jgi:hypothetical protein